MVRSKLLILSDVVRLYGADYYVAEVNTKGLREIIEFDIMRPQEDHQLVLRFEHKTGSVPDTSKPVFWDEKKNQWRYHA
ncbi:hypothetical protein PHYNN_159 [Pantoea phage Phynn]|nr:hypothetical protein PHYNN_159 [Pantoea phage Phynn]